MEFIDEQDGEPIHTAIVMFYQRYREESGAFDGPEYNAVKFGMYLAEHTNELMDELAHLVAYPDPRNP